MMAGCAAESSRIKSYCIKWLSFIVLKTLSKDETSIFQNLEKLEIRIIKLISHLDFNQTCYIYIYVYIFVCIQLYGFDMKWMILHSKFDLIDFLKCYAAI